MSFHRRRCCPLGVVAVVVVVVVVVVVEVVEVVVVVLVATSWAPRRMHGLLAASASVHQHHHKPWLKPRALCGCKSVAGLQHVCQAPRKRRYFGVQYRRGLAGQPG